MLGGGAALYVLYRPNKTAKWVMSGVIVALLIILNIVFWENYLNIFSIVFGISMVISFMQKEAKTIRKISILVGIIGITYYALLQTPINIVIEAVGMGSAIVGIIRLDIGQNPKQENKKG